MRSRHLTLILVVALAATLYPAVTWAQGADVLSAREISDQVQTNMSLVGSGSPAQVRDGRSALLKALRKSGMSNSTRLQYSSSLQQAGLGAMATRDDDLIAINAVIIASEIATPLSVTILGDAIDDSREAIRYEAARGYGRVLSAIADNAAAIPENQIDLIYLQIADRFTTERSYQVLQALILALRLDHGDSELRTRCAIVMCQGISRVAIRWRNPNANEEQALTVFRSINASFKELLGLPGSVDPEFASSAAIASGHALTFLTAWLDSTPPDLMDEAEKQLAIDLGGAAERVLLISHSTLTGEARDVKITPLLQRFVEGQGGQLGAIQDEIDIWTGRSGLLLKSPYNVSAGDFD